MDIDNELKIILKFRELRRDDSILNLAKTLISEELIPENVSLSALRQTIERLEKHNPSKPYNIPNYLLYAYSRHFGCTVDELLCFDNEVC